MVPSAAAAAPSSRAKDDPGAAGGASPEAASVAAGGGLCGLAGGGLRGGAAGGREPRHQVLQARPRGLRVPRLEFLDVHAGRPQLRACLEVRVVHRRPQALGGVAGADEHGLRRRQPLAGVGQEALGVRLDGVLQRRAVDLDRVGHALERPREHARAHHQVVGQRHVRPGALGHLAHGGDVALQVAVELRLAQLRERLRLDALVAVGHVDREQAAEVGPVDRGAHRLAPCLDRQRAAVPVPGGVDPRLRERLAVLAQQVHLVPRAHERRGQACVVDVRAGPAQQIAVEDQDPHGAGP